MRQGDAVSWSVEAQFADEATQFIRHLEIPFCELYNRGFTSLGGVTDTRPNPALAVGNDATHFRPAYELRDDDEERLGRDR